MRFFEKGQLVHITSRALIDIFREKDDCYRFIFQFYATNLGKRGNNVYPADAVRAGQALLVGEKIPDRFVIKEHSPLVDVLDFSLVVNHNHFYLLPRIKNAIPILMQRLNNGFAKFFNINHNRKDAVFGSRYKGVLVETDRQSYAVTRYVSIINPLDIFQPGWREEGLKNKKEALDFLKKYEFSSFLDRIGERNSKILAPLEVLERYSFGTSYKGSTEYLEFAEEFLKEREKLDFSNLFVE
ncbi:MAG TPA: hypothetical protein VJK25_02655 [Patescibacteria group bacterium]|nr:hypothetical protein [Patescibacteria group bacterium]